MMLLLVFIAFSSVASGSNVHPAWLKEALVKAKELDRKDPYLAFEFLEKVKVSRFEQMSDFDKATVLNKLALYKVYLGDFKAAGQFNSDAKRLFPDTETDTGINILLVEGSLLDIAGNTEQSLAMYQQAMEQARLEENNQLLAESYTAIALAHSNSYNDVEAIQYYQQAYTIISSLNDELEMAYLKTNLANTYANLHDYDKAIALQNEAIDYFASNELHYDEMQAQMSLSFSHIAQKEHDKATICYLKMLKLSQFVGEKRFVYFAHIGLANVKIKQEQFEQAAEQMALANQFFSFIQDPYGQAHHYLLEAALATHNQQIEQALDRIERVEGLITELDKGKNINLFVRLSDQKAKVMALLGDYESAFYEKVASEALLADYYSQEREDARSKYKVMFDTEQTELENKVLQQSRLIDQLALEKGKKEHELQRLIIVLFVLIFIMLTVYVYRQIRHSKRLNRLANTDSLTQLANRRYTFHFAKNVFKESQTTEHPLSIVIFDIDHFKGINDRYGHPFGDEVLKGVSDAAQSGLREPDLLGRIGGEEFMVVLKHTELAQAIEIAQRIRQLIEQRTFELNKQVVTVTASFGVSSFNPLVDDFESLFQHADEALYRAKNEGRNRVVSKID
ncbi:tetratricopeptide repeat-containing diguanylate cyclase [Pseudoalteromonas ulvae]|nr:tetratricopeptide repeat-containing diguanylate cyclase [Pseudoalteromonas ulvae]